MSMNFDQAMDVLQRMKQAAPPIAASKLSGVIDLLNRLQAETQSGGDDELPPEFIANLFGGMPEQPPPPPVSTPKPPEPARPVVYPESIADTPPPTPLKPTGQLLRRARTVPPQVEDRPPAPPRPPSTPLKKPSTPLPPPRRVEQARPPTNELPAHPNTTGLFDDIPDRAAPDDPFDPFNFAELYSTDQLSNLPDTSDLFRDLPEFGSAPTDELRNASPDSVLGIEASQTPPARSTLAGDRPDRRDPRPDAEVFDVDALLGTNRFNFDDLPDYEENRESAQTEELVELFDNLPPPAHYQFDEADRSFRDAVTFEVEPEAENPLDSLFGVTGALNDDASAQPPDRTVFDDIPDWFSSTLLRESDERTTADPFENRGAPNMLPSFDDIPTLFGSTNILNDGSGEYTSAPGETTMLPDYTPPDDEASAVNAPRMGGLFDDLSAFGEPQYGDTGRLAAYSEDARGEGAGNAPNTILSGNEGMYALDDLVRFASSALEESAPPDPTRETDEIPAVTPTATALLTNMNEALRPSLMLLRAQAEMLEDRIVGAMTDAEANMLRLMRDNAETALKLLDSLEQVMQLSDHALRLSVERFEVIPLLREAGRVMQERARARRHRITVQLDDSLPPLHADYTRVLTLLTDLMDNAVRYTPVGGSSRISVDLMGDFLLFTVMDTGIGLTPQDMDYIGQPFWRASHQPLVRQQPGTGLRLYLARRILEMHGGELFYSGEPGVGSSFSFTLPVGA